MNCPQCAEIGENLARCPACGYEFVFRTADGITDTVVAGIFRQPCRRACNLLAGDAGLAELGGFEHLGPSEHIVIRNRVALAIVKHLPLAHSRLRSSRNLITRARTVSGALPITLAMARYEYPASSAWAQD